jgi:hypothetical protein
MLKTAPAAGQTSEGVTPPPVVPVLSSPVEPVESVDPPSELPEDVPSDPAVVEVGSPVVVPG